jgi:hypothetical protein
MPVLKVKLNLFVSFFYIFNLCLENTEHMDSPHIQQIVQSEPETWKESLYKFYFRANRIYKQITYYTWRFAEIHSYKFVLFVMVLVAVLKVK